MATISGASWQTLDSEAQDFMDLVVREATAIVTKVTASLGTNVVVAQGAQRAWLGDLNTIKTEWTETVDATILPALVVKWLKANARLIASIAEVLPQSIVDQLELRFTDQSRAVKAFANGARNRLVGIGQILWEDAREEFINGIEQGDSIPDIAARIEKALDIPNSRATVIARTEVISASNAGSIATMRASGLVVAKEWLATEDARTRPTHVAADGQSVNLGAQFQVGGALLDHPGDPFGPPEEVINCRCTLTYDVGDDYIDDLEEDIEDDGEIDETEFDPDTSILIEEPLAATGKVRMTEQDGDAMPWHIVENSSQCDASEPWAVVKDADDSVEGCHESKADALAQMRALYANEDGESKEDDNPSKDNPDEEAAVDITAFQDDGTDIDPDADPNQASDEELKQRHTATWAGVIAIEGENTGDGRQFAEKSLTWENLPIPLRWQKEDSHGGAQVNGVVNVGRIDEIERVGNEIRGSGVIDLDSEDGREVFRRMGTKENPGYLSGISIDADNPENPSGSDVEFVYPEGCDSDAGAIMFEVEDDDNADDEDEFDMACMFPEFVIFHSGRIRAATMVDLPAFIEAQIYLTDDASLAASAVARAAFGAVGGHDTPTTDSPWDASAQEKKLAEPLTVEVARNMYAWIDESEAEEGEIPKSACKFPHHEVGDGGKPGAANLTACSAAIGALNGARGGSDIPADDRQGVYDHVAGHLRDADQEPPPLESKVDTIVAAAHLISIPDRPPMEWFSEPTDLPAIGAITVTDEGRLYGYLAPRRVAHRSYPDKRVEVPMNNVDYGRWMNRATIVDGGERIQTGPLTMECGHAATLPSYGSDVAMDHYDNACSIVATARIGENQHGVWVAGALLPGVNANQVARMLACQLSGDWRPHRENPKMRELAGALFVPVPGFPMESPKVSVRLSEEQLVASAVPIRYERRGKVATTQRDKRNSSVFQKAARILARDIGQDRDQRLAAMANLVRENSNGM